MLLLNVLVSTSSHALLIHPQLLPLKVLRATSPTHSVLLSLLILRRLLSVSKTSSTRPLLASEQTADRRRRRKHFSFNSSSTLFNPLLFLTTQSNSPKRPTPLIKEEHGREKRTQQACIIVCVCIRDALPTVFYLAFSFYNIKIHLGSLLEMHKCLICCCRLMMVIYSGAIVQEREKERERH